MFIFELASRGFHTKQHLFNITEVTLLEFLFYIIYIFYPLGNISNHKSLYMLVQNFFLLKMFSLSTKKEVK